jgi:hypothetical protein
MKNRSFLFLIAALALGLALFGCSTDSDDGGTTTNTVYQGWAGDVEDIAAAFDKVDAVYLTKGITVGGGQTLSIKAGKTLYLNGNTITMADNSSVVTASVTSIVWSGEERAVVTGKIVVADGAAVCLIGPEGSFPTASVTGDLAKVVELAPATSGSLSYTESDGRAFAATNNRALVFTESTGAWNPTAGGTRVVYIGDLEIPATPGGYTISGSLSVAGNVTLAGTLAGPNGEIEVLGKLTSNISTDGVAGINLAEGKVTARSIATKGGKFAKAGSITAPSLSSLFEGTLSTFGETLYAAGPVQFTKDVVFTGAATLLNDADFGGDVKFTAESEIGGKATFAGGKKVDGKVFVEGPLTVSGTDGIVLTANGAIAYANGVTSSFLNSAGTLAALGGNISVKPGANELLIQDVSGVGTFTAGNKPITLGTGDTIKVEGTAGVYFDGVGSIASANYSIGDAAGTLSSDKGFILTATGIRKISDGTSITFGVSEEDGTSLSLLSNSTVIIEGVNIDLSAAGSIGVYGGNLILTDGGSITAGNLAWSGTIAGTLADGGSLLVGSLSAAGAEGDAGSIATDAIVAGSIGTQSSAPFGVIVTGAVFLPTPATVANGLDGVVKNADGGSASSAKGGTILVFNHTGEL